MVVPVLDDINLTVNAGQSTAVMGRSGSGKSTLLSLIAGIIRPDSGEIELDGQKYGGLSESQLTDVRASKIGFVFQNFHLVSYLTAIENILLPLRVGGVHGQDDNAAELLERVGLVSRANHLPHQLSGGEMQRVALARALVHRPQLVLADEPSGSLDEQTGEQVMDLMFELISGTGAGLVLVTHSRVVAARCQTQVTINGGRIERSIATT